MNRLVITKISLKSINPRIALSLIIWVAIAVSGQFYLSKYEMRPGAIAISPAFMTASEMHKNIKNLPTLLVFAHPQCPCTHATLRELERLVAHSQGLVETRILFLQPANAPREWIETSLWELASKIPHVSVSTVSDQDLERFGEMTSGQAMLYDAEGNLIFSGGITGERGHEGDNTGRSAIEEYLHGRELLIRQTPVFGCALTASEKKL